MLIAMLARGAFAQDVVLEDFTGPTGSWFVTDGVGLFVVPADPYDGLALECTPNAGSTDCALFSATRFPITHDTVRIQTRTEDPLGAVTTVGLVSDFGAPEVDDTVMPIAPGAWTPVEIDASAGCGEWYRFEVAHEADGPTTIDDVVSTGGVCPQLVDLDADGLCPRGNDLDGDGVCVGTDEPAEPGLTVECNESTPGARCLVLTTDPFVVGQRAELRVDGAFPGEKILVVWASAPGQSCPPQLGVTCLDVANPTIIRQKFADANGHIDFRITVPNSAAGTTLYLQATAVRYATPSDVSEVVVIPVP